MKRQLPSPRKLRVIILEKFPSIHLDGFAAAVWVSVQESFFQQTEECIHLRFVVLTALVTLLGQLNNEVPTHFDHSAAQSVQLVRSVVLTIVGIGTYLAV